MMITQITVDSIVTIGQEILKVKQECSGIGNLIKGERRKQRVNDEYDKIIFDNVSNDIRSVIVDCIQGKIESIAFYGTLSVTPVQLYLKYKQYRESYSIHDDLYFYFFNYDKKIVEYSISFFEPNHQQVNVEQSNEVLYNIQINW